MTRVPPTEMTGVEGAMIKKFSRKMFGDVPEPLEVMWHNKQVLRFYVGLGQKAQRWSSCREDLKSYAHMATAALVGASAALLAALV